MRGEANIVHGMCICILIVQAFLLWIVVMRDLKKTYLVLGRSEGFFLLGDFNARVGRSVQRHDVIGMFGKDTRNASC